MLLNQQLGRQTAALETLQNDMDSKRRWRFSFTLSLYHRLVLCIEIYIFFSSLTLSLSVATISITLLTALGRSPPARTVPSA